MQQYYRMKTLSGTVCHGQRVNNFKETPPARRFDPSDALSAKGPMRQFDASGFTAPSFTARDVLRIRSKEGLSQEVLARYMGVTKSTVAKWESRSIHQADGAAPVESHR
jgi:DNA-binding transcriptional regulator YiaG